jgi:hypothetical protein
MTGEKSNLNAISAIKLGHVMQAALFMFEDHYKDKMTPEQKQRKIQSIAETIEMVFKERYIALREGEALSDGEAENVYEEAKHALGLDK